MKVTIIEGSPEELAEYEARTGLIGLPHAVADASDEDEPLPADDQASAGPVSDVAEISSFIAARARTQAVGEQVAAYTRGVLGLGGTEVAFGTSKASKDGRADYLLVYDSGPRHYGAVAYVNAKNAGLTLRLTKDDVADIDDPGLKTRDVQDRNGYQVNCPVKTSEAIELAVKLTQRALDKVRSTGS
jgi:hypothetical protein